ncbi:hypothetical protein [Kitasatospora sp. NPDC058046]|uniref:hypothetical protein n=1 Tax=Kitasatospora sp. NPDC058046 TaxID=3346312 RepID=UPI0036DE9A4E
MTAAGRRPPAAPVPCATLDCGHRPTPTRGCGTGSATDPVTGTTHCCPCSDDQARHTTAASTRFVAHVSTDATTWSGGVLAAIDTADRHQRPRTARTPTGGSWQRHTRHATGADDTRWYGVNPGPGMAVRLRRVRTRTP